MSGKLNISLIVIFVVFVAIIPGWKSLNDGGSTLVEIEGESYAEVGEVEQAPSIRPSDRVIQSAFENRRSNFQVEGDAVVYRVLSDDLDGSRHQRFLLRTSTGLSLLIAHNIDLAPRIRNIRVGDRVSFYGEYEYNDKGGVVHWTHHDPGGRHVGGWLKHNGKTYQ